MSRLLSVLVVLFVVATLVSCPYQLPVLDNPNDPANFEAYSTGDGESSSDPSDDPSPEPAGEPYGGQFDSLFPHSVGSSWTYRTGGDDYSIAVDSVTVEADRITILMSGEGGSGGGSYTLTSEELSISATGPGHILGADGFSHNPHLMSPVEVGRAWNGELSSNGYRILFEAEIVSLTETVTVPAAIFSDCIHVRVDFSYPEGYDQADSFTPARRDFYFQTNVGPVKRVDTNLDASVHEIALVSYDIQ